MSTFVRGNRDLIKGINRNLLLNIIRREGELSRKRLTKLSGLSVGSVSGIVSELISSQWIRETGESESTGGRPQTMIRLNPRAGYALGLKLMEERVVIAITDFECRVIKYCQKSLVNCDSYSQLIDQLAEIILEVLDTTQIDLEQLLGVGVGLAGIIRSREGIVHHSPFFGWRDVPLATLLSQQIYRPVFIENDVNTLTLAEQLFGAGRYASNFVVMTIGRGIGLGIVVNDQLYQGAGGAGELGHTLIVLTDNEGSLKTETLEGMASDPALIDDVRQIVLDSDQSVESLEDVVRLAESGNKNVIEAVERNGKLLGIALANVANIINPELIIVSGEGTIAGAVRLTPMIDTLRQHAFDGLLDNVDIVIEPTDDQAWARGAASLVISKMFESPILDAQLTQ